jgi:hypothetical protein
MRQGLPEDDPVFIQNGMRLTNRCGEKINGQFKDPLHASFARTLPEIDPRGRIK